MVKKLLSYTAMCAAAATFYVGASETAEAQTCFILPGEVRCSDISDSTAAVIADEIAKTRTGQRMESRFNEQINAIIDEAERLEAGGGGATQGTVAANANAVQGTTDAVAEGTMSTEDSEFVPAGMTLTWTDEFDNLKLSPNGEDGWAPYWVFWNVRYLEGNSDEGFKTYDEEFNMGDKIRAAGYECGERCIHDVSEGTLRLRSYPVPVESENWGNKPYTAGMISQEKWFDQQYGYWETRFRINAIGNGHHIAIWLLPSDPKWPPEIDMLEVVGPKPTEYSANAHGIENEMAFWEAPNGNGEWYTLGFHWTESDMVWTADGEVVKELGNYINEPMYFLVSWEIDSDWPGSPDGSTPWPAEIEFDYVRIYQ